MFGNIHFENQMNMMEQVIIVCDKQVPTIASIG